MQTKLHSLAVCAMVACAPGAFATETTMLPEIQVQEISTLLFPGSATDSASLLDARGNTDDTARLIEGLPGISLYGAGGISSLPAIHGLADDRLRIKVDGMDLISGCPNHMNSPLSYMDPAQVARVTVFAGIAPVSSGGDSIGGTITVDSAEPEFASGPDTLFKGEAGAFFRSNGSSKSSRLAVTLASEILSVTYRGSVTMAGNFRAGGDFKPAAATDTGWLSGSTVGSSRYESENHLLRFALRSGSHLAELTLGRQNVPYEDFPNQRMDMLENSSNRANFRYEGHYRWGRLETRAYQENTRHVMNFGQDKQFAYGNAPGMPMDTEGRNTGASLRTDIAFSDSDIIRSGIETQQYRLNDWWSPSGTGAMMAPNTFWNIRDGQRDRLAVFAEWERQWDTQWAGLFGVRSEQVDMNAGPVQGYSVAMYGDPQSPASIPGAFNARDRHRRDDNIDLTLLTRFTPDAGRTFEAGYARKTRSPSLYERFAWASNNSMVMNMVNWYGDGNGYVGNIDLKPETAHTLSVSAQWHDAERNGWSLKVSPYYTYVRDFIDATNCATVGKICAGRPDGFVNLSLDNQAARIRGVDVSGHASLTAGLTVTGALSYLRGSNPDSGDNLYNIMPTNLRLAVEKQMDGWIHSVEMKLVEAKTRVQAVRQEVPTGGYGLLNLHSSRNWNGVRLDVGVENLFDRYYAAPLGGAYVGQGATMGTVVPHGIPVPGKGRSINIGLSAKF